MASYALLKSFGPNSLKPKDQEPVASQSLSQRHDALVQTSWISELDHILKSNALERLNLAGKQQVAHQLLHSTSDRIRVKAAEIEAKQVEIQQIELELLTYAAALNALDLQDRRLQAESTLVAQTIDERRQHLSSLSILSPIVPVATESNGATTPLFSEPAIPSMHNQSSLNFSRSLC
jgi:hypothetical protein